MQKTDKTVITISALINSPVERLWELWTEPKHIMKWNYASDDWHTTRAENDLVAGGKFLSHMAAKDGSAGFDFVGEYNSVIKYKSISYSIADGRKVSIIFGTKGDKTEITESFEAENTNPVELQRAGWQSILDNFKRYAESISNKPI